MVGLTSYEVEQCSQACEYWAPKLREIADNMGKATHREDIATIIEELNKAAMVIDHFGSAALPYIEARDATQNVTIEQLKGE